MTWVMFAAAAWVALAVCTAVLFGLFARVADRRAGLSSWTEEVSLHVHEASPGRLDPALPAG